MLTALGLVKIKSIFRAKCRERAMQAGVFVGHHMHTGRLACHCQWYCLEMIGVDLQ